MIGWWSTIVICWRLCIIINWVWWMLYNMGVVGY